eukprot:GFUD01101096.1.p1 GENE.GFUD01101096.1~~GFUD01101096.1.p1  ORF type:complete len:121 (+),score=45.12 GFUD01101096.1:32-364(+)
MISARKFHQKQSNDENMESGKIIQAETFGQITNEMINYSSETPKVTSGAGYLSGKIIEAETFGHITNETVNYRSESPKEKSPYIFGAGNLSDLMKAWPEGNFASAINSHK